MAENKAKELLWPTDSNILLRFVFLYVGQGTSTIVLAKDDSTYKSVLVDINLDLQNGGVNVPALMSDLLDGGDLDIFANSHPHDDHLRGIVDLSDEIPIKEIWHSGHRPGKKYDDAFKELAKVIKKVKKDGGKEIVLQGSREQQSIGEASYYVLSPAEYVTDDISDEDPNTRYRRIHEQCVVLKFGTGETWVMVPGDANRDAFEKHITNYHRKRLNAVVLAAPHHGSRTFFRYNEEDEPYVEALDTIDPEYVVISAPKQSESKHDHPHDDAVKIYDGKVGQNNVLHTGQNRFCYIFDVFDDGTYTDIQDDNGEVAKAYPIENDDGGKGDRQSFTKREQISVVAGSRFAR